MFFNPGILRGYIVSFAKYAVAFFKPYYFYRAFSISSWATLFRSRLVSLSSSSIRAASSGSSFLAAVSFHHRRKIDRYLITYLPCSLFTHPAYMGEISFVTQLPFMSISLFVNHFSYPKDNWNFGLNIGYLIFGPKFIP
jgi:hypothetical protein